MGINKAFIFTANIAAPMVPNAIPKPPKASISLDIVLTALEPILKKTFRALPDSSINSVILCLINSLLTRTQPLTNFNSFTNCFMVSVFKALDKLSTIRFKIKN